MSPGVIHPSAQAEVWIVKKSSECSGHASGGILPFGMAWMALPRSRKKRISNVRFGIGIPMPSFPNPIRTFYIWEWVPRTG